MDKCVRHECTRVLLERVNEHVSFRAFDGGKTSSDDASSPSTCDVEHTETRVNRGVNAESLSTHILSASGQSSRAWKTAFRQQKIPRINTTRLQEWMGRRTYLLVFLILYWILLERLISDALQIIHERLQRKYYGSAILPVTEAIHIPAMEPASNPDTPVRNSPPFPPFLPA